VLYRVLSAWHEEAPPWVDGAETARRQAPRRIPRTGSWMSQGEARRQRPATVNEIESAHLECNGKRPLDRLARTAGRLLGRLVHERLLGCRDPRIMPGVAPSHHRHRLVRLAALLLPGSAS
jgi:hypothetical protein